MLDTHFTILNKKLLLIRRLILTEQNVDMILMSQAEDGCEKLAWCGQVYFVVRDECKHI